MGCSLPPFTPPSPSPPVTHQDLKDIQLLSACTKINRPSPLLSGQIQPLVCTILTIYAPMIYAGNSHYLGKWEGVGPWKSRVFWALNGTRLNLCTYDLCGQQPLLGQVGGGWALEITSFLGPKWHSPKFMHL
jgi:hypothetical protein